VKFPVGDPTLLRQQRVEEHESLHALLHSDLDEGLHIYLRGSDEIDFIDGRILIERVLVRRWVCPVEFDSLEGRGDVGLSLTGREEDRDVLGLKEGGETGGGLSSSTGKQYS
jgi:hypothetical protein